MEAGDKSGDELYPGQSTCGGEYLPGAFDSGGFPGKWTKEGASCLEQLEQSVLSSSLAARPVEGGTEKISDWKPVINPVQDLWRGLPTRSIRLWGWLWTVDSGRGCRA